MFRLHERTQRRLLAASFVVCCVVPTALVLWVGAERRLPGRVEVEARRLSGLLGLGVELGAVCHPHPGVVRYEDLALSDPETGRRLASMRALTTEWGRRIDQAGNRREVLQLEADGLHFDPAAIEPLWELLGRALRRRVGAEPVDVDFAAATLRLHTQAGPLVLARVDGRLEELPGGVQAQLTFSLDDSPTAEPIRLRLVRNRQTQPPASGFELDTGTAALPCALLAQRLGTCRSMGPNARFSGYLWANQTPGATGAGWEGELSGQLLDVDLGRLAGEHAGWRMAGTAEVTINNARFRHGRLEQASATITAGPGVVGRRALDSATRWLGWQPFGQTPADSETVPFDQLAFSLAVDARGVWFRGRCAAGGPGTIIAGGRQWLLGEPPSARQPLPLVALVRALCPAESETCDTLPATPQSAWLAERLPLASEQSAGGSVARMPE